VFTSAYAVNNQGVYGIHQESPTYYNFVGLVPHMLSYIDIAGRSSARGWGIKQWVT